MKKYLYFLFPSITLVLFVIWTILVKTVDVKYINDIGYLGFYNSNIAINEWVKGFDGSLYHLISSILFYGSIGLGLIFALVGLIQWIKRKSLAKVDPILFCLASVYISVGIAYGLFELLKINYSPLSVKGDLKASYPSSHVFGAISIFTVTIMVLGSYFKFKKPLKILSTITVVLFSILVVITRLLSGRHYFSDIIGSIFLALLLIAVYMFLHKFLEQKGIKFINGKN